MCRRPLPRNVRRPITTGRHRGSARTRPQRYFLIPAERWIEAPPELRALGADLGIPLVAYKRRIGRYLLWRAGPAAKADARYMALAADDPTEQWTFRLFPDGHGEGDAPGGSHTRFRTWKEDLRDASIARAG